MSTISIHQPLINYIWSSHTKIRVIFLVLIGSLALWGSAKLHIPFYPVPITMQTMVVLVIGIVYGPRLGAVTVIFYLVQGAVGLPVFSGTPERGIGLVYLLGPTGGYLLGFVPAAWLVGYLSQKGWDRKFFSTLLAMISGNIIIYCLGLLWLGTSLGWDKPILEWGLIPFLLGDALKISLGTLALPLMWKFLGSQKDF